MDTELDGVEVETKSYMLVPLMEYKLDDATGALEGYGATFGNVDLGGDVCEKGCFDRSIADHAKSDSMPGMYYNHSPSEPVGDWLEMKVNGKGLAVAGQLWIGRGIPRAEQEYMRAKSKGPKGLSIGYVTRKAAWSKDQKTRSLIDVDVREISLTPFPMNPKATITSAKSCLLVDGNYVSKRQAEHILRDVGGLTQDQAKASIAKAWGDVLAKADGRDALTPETDALAELAAMVRANIARTK